MRRPTDTVWFREYWVPLLVWVVLTQLFSSDALASSETSRFIVPLLHFLLPGWAPDQIEVLHAVIRKMGHVAEFFVMGALAYRAVRLGQGAIGTLVVAGVFVFSAATLDEVHQMLTALREPSPIDVGYDFLGGTIGIWLFSRAEHRRTRYYSVVPGSEFRTNS